MPNWLPKLQTLWGEDGAHRTPYMTRLVWAQARLHVFHRGDRDPDAHTHPWDFWTFPLTSYGEEVLDLATGRFRYHVVCAFRRHFRHAGYAHRVVGRVAGPDHRRVPGRIVTLAWTTGPDSDDWGFWVKVRGGLRLIPWRAYIFDGDRGEDPPVPADAQPPLRLDWAGRRMTRCQADDDDMCAWAGCPQLRDNEPGATGRHCPHDALSALGEVEDD